MLSKECLVLHRHKEPQGEDSGWYVGPAELDEIKKVAETEDYEWMPTYELLNRGRGHLLKVLTLPPRHMVFFKGHEITGVSDPDSNEILPQEG